MKYPGIENTRGGSDKVCERLAEVLSEIREEIPEESFKKVC
jgi:hypothetical protein